MNNPFDNAIERLVRIYKNSKETHDITVMTKISGISKGLMVPEELEQTITKMETIMEISSGMVFFLVGIRPFEQKKKEKAFNTMESMEDCEAIVRELISISTSHEKGEDNEEPESIE